MRALQENEKVFQKNAIHLDGLRRLTWLKRRGACTVPLKGIVVHPLESRKAKRLRDVSAA
jgi:hypothetical protein